MFYNSNAMWTLYQKVALAPSACPPACPLDCPMPSLPLSGMPSPVSSLSNSHLSLPPHWPSWAGMEVSFQTTAEAGQSRHRLAYMLQRSLHKRGVNMLYGPFGVSYKRSLPWNWSIFGVLGFRKKETSKIHSVEILE